MRGIAKKLKIAGLTLGFVLACHCSGGDISSTASSSPTIDPAPDFTPTSSENLSDMVVNTFDDNGNSISVSPDTIDFDANGDIAKDDELTEQFVLTNSTNTTHTFKFAFYAVSSGFTILDENKVNLGAWDGITLTAGESKTFYVKFNAWLFGVQTTYLTITTDVTGYIQLPMRATVTGASDFRIIPTGYLCSDTSAPDVKYLDYLKVANGETKTQDVKICNTGGGDIEVNSVQILTATSPQLSKVFDNNAYQDFIWSTEDEISSSFATGLEPDFSKTFTEPTFITYSGAVPDGTIEYSALIDETGAAVENTIIPAGQLLRLNVNFSPTLDIEAPQGELYEPVSLNAKMRIKTSIGTIDIPVIGASGGKEPVLKMSYRLSDSEIWREADLSSDGPSIYFGTVALFKDWVTDNFKAAEIKIENVGSGSKDLEFYPKSLNGYFEYYATDGTAPKFPFTIAAGGSAQSFEIRYMPTPSVSSDTTSWDFGQFYFEHTAGNGPEGKLALVGEEASGYAVELKFGGSTLKRSYSDTESKNLCVMQIDNGSAAATPFTFTVNNNNQDNDLSVSWSIAVATDSGGSFTATPASGTFTVPANSSQNFTIDLLADPSTSEGSNIKGTLSVQTSYPSSLESKYATQLASLESRDFTVPFNAQASSTGVCALGGGNVVGKDSDGLVEATILVDRISMILTSLIEPARNPAAFKFHLPVEIDYKNNRIRVSKEIPFVYDKTSTDFNPINQFRAYAHQITNINGCPPIATNPYRLEFEKGSWTGEGFDCNENGQIAFSDKDGVSTTLDTDTACLPTNGGEEVEVDGVKWVVFYQDFVKFDTSGCQMEFYGKVATFAYRPDTETFYDVFKRADEQPEESEEYYEAIFGTYQYNSYIFFNQAMTCGTKTYKAGDTETDPDALKACYTAIAGMKDSNTRNTGLLNECAYFNFIIDQGVTPSDATSANPNTDNWTGYGTYEPHADATGEYDTKYDITLYNLHAQAFALSPADRFSFFRHPGHLLYSELYVTFTTKQLADQNDTSSWMDLIAKEARMDFDKDQVYLVDQNPYDIAKYWTDDGINNHYSNVIDDSNLTPGIDYGGYSIGSFHNCESSGEACDIIPSGAPVNFDENNLLVLTGLTAFHGKGNLAPGFAKEDDSGKGKALYISLHGCLVEGDPDPSQGCFPSQLDGAKMTENTSTTDDTTDVVSLYKQYGILPEGYPGDITGTSASDCTNAASAPENDPTSSSYDPYKYMSCVNFKIFPVDRDRFTNYYDSQKFIYQKDYYGSSTCGYGM